MAYLIFNSHNNIVKIASNDSDRDSLNIVLTDHTIKDVSDSDFLKIRTGAAVATYDGTNVTITDTGNTTFDETVLKFIFNDLIKTITAFLENNQSNSLYVGINNYKEYLENFDTSTLTFPVDKSWEEYCNENSITFYHPLQIP